MKKLFWGGVFFFIATAICVQQEEGKILRGSLNARGHKRACSSPAILASLPSLDEALHQEEGSLRVEKQQSRVCNERRENKKKNFFDEEDPCESCCMPTFLALLFFIR